MGIRQPTQLLGAHAPAPAHPEDGVPAALAGTAERGRAARFGPLRSGAGAAGLRRPRNRGPVTRRRADGPADRRLPEQSRGRDPGPLRGAPGGLPRARAGQGPTHPVRGRPRGRGESGGSGPRAGRGGSDPAPGRRGVRGAGSGALGRPHLQGPGRRPRLREPGRAGRGARGSHRLTRARGHERDRSQRPGLPHRPGRRAARVEDTDPRRGRAGAGPGGRRDAGGPGPGQRPERKARPGDPRRKDARRGGPGRRGHPGAHRPAATPRRQLRARTRQRAGAARSRLRHGRRPELAARLSGGIPAGPGSAHRAEGARAGAARKHHLDPAGSIPGGQERRHAPDLDRAAPPGA